MATTGVKSRVARQVGCFYCGLGSKARSVFHNLNGCIRAINNNGCCVLGYLYYG
jgi:hypothetical protein